MGPYSKLKILVVDDTESNRYFLAHHLTSAGFEVIEAVNGEEALEKISLLPDLVLLDINLPDRSGLEVCAIYKENPAYQSIPVIHTSANFTKASDQFKGIESGGDGYLISPMDPLVLLGTVKTWLRVSSSDKLLKHSIDLLEQEKALRETFVSTLTHDLRTPLTAAKLGAQVMAKKLDENSPLQIIAARIITNINRTDMMIRDLLDANLIKAGEKLPLKIEYLDMNDTLQEIIDELGTIHGDVFDLVANSEVDGYWDKSAIRRILENLCNNAIKYGEKGCRVTIKLETTKDQVVLKVHNTGNPINERDQKTLFEPYKRAETADNQKGWGLGLNLVKGLTESHGGFVEVSSSYSKGTEFRVFLPMDARKN